MHGVKDKTMNIKNKINNMDDARREKLGEVIRFGIVGGLATVLQYVIYLAMMPVLNHFIPRMGDHSLATTANTIAYIDSVNAGQMAGSAQKEVVLNWTDEGKKFSGDDYLLSFALPNFYFHVSMVHAILRNNGVAVGKLDYLGPYD